MNVPRTIRYVAKIKHVRELSLVSSADFNFWAEYLQAERLMPVRCGEAAQIMIVAAEMAYFGIRFTEVSFSVRVRSIREQPREGMRLLHAFTSSRLFSWCERTMFSTPYSYANCHLSIGTSNLVQVSESGVSIFDTEMSTAKRLATRAGDET